MCVWPKNKTHDVFWVGCPDNISSLVNYFDRALPQKRRISYFGQLPFSELAFSLQHSHLLYGFTEYILHNWLFMPFHDFQHSNCKRFNVPLYSDIKIGSQIPTSKLAVDCRKCWGSSSDSSEIKSKYYN